ncbi:RNA-binding protein involved in heterochromatin assembly dri1-like [Wolffia australiana]
MNRKPGDWDCGACRHLNFSRRETCQRCAEPRPSEWSEFGAFFGGGRSEFGGFVGGGGGGGGAQVRPGDWYCSCGYHNFASRATCFKCGSFKDDLAAVDPFRFRGFGGGAGGFGGGVAPVGGGGGPRSGWKSGDWICARMGCNEHNFASRMECFRCSAPREAGAGA